MNWLRLLPEQASTQAPDVDRVYLLLIGVSLAIIVLVVGLVLTLSLRYRRGTTAKRGPLRELVARQFEIGWTAATFFLFFFLFWFTASAQFTTLVPPRNAMEVHVSGKQWMWKTQHGNGAREINSLHVPVNVPVRVVLTSEDVIHSFFVPAFPHQAGRASRPLSGDLVQGDENRNVSPVLHAVLRNPAFAHDWQRRGAAAGGIRQVAARAAAG